MLKSCARSDIVLSISCRCVYLLYKHNNNSSTTTAATTTTIYSITHTCKHTTDRHPKHTHTRTPRGHLHTGSYSRTAICTGYSIFSCVMQQEFGSMGRACCVLRGHWSCVDVQRCAYVCVCACVCACVCICMCVHVSRYVSVCMCVHVHVCVDMFLHFYVPVYAYV